jgi:hypothetical protein
MVEKGEKNLNKWATGAGVISLVAAIALLGFYALGFIGSGAKEITGQAYTTGGFTYSGGFQNRLFDGYGTIRFQDGSVYSGQFKEGRFNGDGMLYGNGRIDVHFQDGRPDSGTFDIKDNRYEYDAPSETVKTWTWDYNGKFNQEGQQGTGTFVFADGSMYLGDFLKGWANGDGLYKNANGDIIYSGGFMYGLFNGFGKYQSPDGWAYEGNFKDGLFDGEGTLTVDETMIRGIWEMGVQTTRHD